MIKTALTAAGGSGYATGKRCVVTKILLVMKLTFLFLTAAFLQVSARSISQTITLSVKDASLQKVIAQLQQQTGYAVSYSEHVFDGTKPVTVEVNRLPLKDFLELIMKDQPLRYSLTSKSVLIYRKETDKQPESFFIPPVTVSGRVTDSSGNPLAGATVQVKGTRQVSVTDANGSFVIGNVKDDAILVISFVGYSQQQVMIKGKSEINIQLGRVVNELENVEVTLNNGYQKIPKERATGSFDFIDNKKFNEQVSANVLDRLEGIANGLTIDRTSTAGLRTHNTGISIRGLSTINGYRDPLIIVDNFPYDGDLSNLNPNNVESITILKDAAAASIWGAKAGNGVIVITTKQGRFGQRMKVSANVNLSITEKPDLFSLNVLSASDFADFEKILFSQGFYNRIEHNTRKIALSPVVELLIKQRDGLISEADANAQIDAIKNHDLRNDFEKYIYRQAVHKQAAVNIAGGTNNTAYNLFAGYDKDISNLNAGSQRINLGTNNTFKPLKNLEISAGVQFTQTNSSSGRMPYGFGAYNYSSFAPLYTRIADDKGNALPVYTYRQSFIDTFAQGKLLDWKYYPLDDWKYTNTKNDQTDFVVNTSLSYQFTSALKLNVSNKYERQRGNTITLQDQKSYSVRNSVNTFTQLPADGSAPIYPFPLGDVKSQYETELTTNQFRGQLTFDKSWNKHMLSVLAAAETGSTAISSYQGYPLYGFNPDDLTSMPVDVVNYYPSIINGANNPLISNYPAFAETTQRFVSVLGNAAYTYNGKYTFSASARRDGANIFGATTNNRWKPLWSAGLAWDIAKENFYHSSSVPSLKLRATYGYDGNLMPEAIGQLTLSSYSLDYYQQRPRYGFYSYNNPDLRWENVAMTNIGIDFSTRKNIISGSLEYFHKRTSNLFGISQTDYTTIPDFSILKNVASTAGNGVDIHLITRNINRKIKWNTTWNVNWYRDRTVSYYLPNQTAASYVGRAAISVGGKRPVYGIYSYNWAGLDPQTGDPRGYLDGKASTDYSGIANAPVNSVHYRGAASPAFYGSITNSVEWNRLSMSINMLYRLGYYFRRRSIDYYDLASSGTGSADYDKRWMKPGDEQHTNVPSLVTNRSDRDKFYANSDALTEKGDQVRLNYIQLNYALKPGWLDRLGMSAVNIYFNASNLGIIWRANKDGIDPDYPNNISSVKPLKTVSFGLNASF